MWQHFSFTLSYIHLSCVRKGRRKGVYTGIYAGLHRGSLDETISQIGNPSKPQSL